MQKKVLLGTRHAPCLLGDDALRSLDNRSFVSVVTSTPCLLMSVRTAVMKNSMGPLTLRLLQQLRDQSKAADQLCRETITSTRLKDAEDKCDSTCPFYL